MVIFPISDTVVAASLGCTKETQTPAKCNDVSNLTPPCTSALILQAVSLLEPPEFLLHLQRPDGNQCKVPLRERCKCYQLQVPCHSFCYQRTYFTLPLFLSIKNFVRFSWELNLKTRDTRFTQAQLVLNHKDSSVWSLAPNSGHGFPHMEILLPCLWQGCSLINKAGFP